MKWFAKIQTRKLEWVRTWGLGIVLACFIALLYTHLGRDYLFDWDEGIYAELGRELVATRNLVVTTWNGTPWFEKPPGVAWVSALGLALGGTSAFGARLFFPIIAGYTLFALYRLGTARGGRQHGILAAALLAGFALFLSRTRGVNADMPLLAAIITTLWFLTVEKQPWQVALAIALGIWFKGPAGLLSVLIAAPLLITKPKQYLIRLTVYFLLFIIPWHLYAYVTYGQEFLTPYIYEQVFRRATAQIEFHFETRWYYFTYLFENLGIGVILVAAIGAIKMVFQLVMSKRPSWEEVSTGILPIWWTLVPLALFTFAKTRLFWYILPIYPGFALLVTEALTGWSKTKVSRYVTSMIILGIILQTFIAAARSVEIRKKTAIPSDRIAAVSQLALRGVTENLAILVPESERRAQALLPDVATLSSSFRYGGMPAVVFYYRGPVQFYYDVDAFDRDVSGGLTYGLVEKVDAQRLTSPYHVEYESGSVLVIGGRPYAQR